MAHADEVRDQQRAAWARLSASWEKWDAIILDQLAPAGDAIIKGLGIKGLGIKGLGIGSDQQHLDVASGTGEPGLSIARMAPSGRTVLTDLSAEMLAVAARRASALGITNVETAVCSADDLPFEDATFDSISVRFGFMFFPDLPKATNELVRVLKPGGRLGASVWVKPEANPWTSIVMRAIASEVTLPPPDPNGPNMFRCAAPGQISELYAAAGLHDLREWDVEVSLVTASTEEYWVMMSEHVSLVAAALQRVDTASQERIRDRAIADVGAYAGADGMIRVPGMARCAVGTKPSRARN